jgi:hypothetical protein
VKRSELILNLAREITHLRDKKAGLETDLRSVNEALREKTGQFASLVPNADEIIEGPLPIPLPTSRRGRPNLSDEILAVVTAEPCRVFTADDIVTLLPNAKAPSVRSTMARMRNDRQLQRVGAGRYQLATKPETGAAIEAAPETSTEEKEVKQSV